MKKLLFILMITHFQIFSQRFANEWVNYSQTYLKLVVDVSGIYRISKADLDAAGFSTVGKNPKNFQVFFRGLEMAIKVNGESDNSFDTNDYIEFYAMKNDGKQDDELYRPKTRANKYYSLYTEETGYFLTVGSTNGKRITDPPSVNTSLTSDPYYMARLLKVYDDEYNYNIATGAVPTVQQSYYEPYEGMVSTRFRFTIAPKSFTQNLKLDNYTATPNIPVNFEVLVSSRRNIQKRLSYDFGAGINGQFDMFNFEGYLINRDIPTLTPLGEIPVDLKFVSTANNANAFSLFYYIAKYPSLPVFVNNSEIETIVNASGNSRLTLTNASQPIFAIDFTDFENQRGVNVSVSGAIADLYISNTNSKRNIFITNQTRKPKRLEIVNFRNINQLIYDYIIITDLRTINGANEYKTYRESQKGGSYKVLVANTQEIFDQFNYGERSPIAIKRFSDYMTSTTQKMKYLFLIGQSISQAQLLKVKERAGQPSDDFVPTFGFPGSDIMLTSELLGKPATLSSIPTGRLVVTTDAEITTYLNKVKEHESRTESTWQKNLVSIVGPKTGDLLGGEYKTLYDTMEQLRGLAHNSPFAASSTNYTTFNKPLNSYNPTLSYYDLTGPPQEFYDAVNNGASIVAYYGHGSSEATWNNIGYMSKSTAQPDYVTSSTINVGGNLYTDNHKYTFLIASGCGVADSFFGNKDIASDWVNVANKGALNALSQSFLSFESYDTRAMLKLYDTWFGSAPSSGRIGKNLKPSSTLSMINEPIGLIVDQAAENTFNAYPGGDLNSANTDIYFIANLQQTILLGDPANALLKDPNTVQPLSLSLLDVKAINADQKTEITWKTENEVNFYGFDVEKSIDAGKFEKIGFVKGLGLFKEQNNYIFEDSKPYQGINYYRLKMIDQDGKSTYSKIISVNFESIENKFNVFGNPISNGLFSFQLNGYQNNSAILTDIKGNKINIEVDFEQTSIFNVRIKKNLPKGIYLFKVTNSKGETFSKKIMAE